MKEEFYITALRALLTTSGFTQTYLAQHLHVTFATLNRWLNGHNKPQPAHIDAITRLYREHIGRPSIETSVYTQLLKRASACKMRGIHTLLEKDKALQQEFVIDTTFNSNTIEGTTLTLRETQVLIYEQHGASNRPFIDQLLTSNHAAIVKDLFNGWHRHDTLSEAIIQSLHKRLFNGVRDDAGAYAKLKRGIAGLNIQLPFPEDIPEEMQHFIAHYAKKPKTMHAIEWMAETHAAFELIHPFGDGNGRVGRLILVMQCLQSGYPPIVIETARKATYYEVLEEAQRRERDHLVQFFVEELERAYRITLKYGRSRA